MAVPYQNILKAVALRANQVQGGTAANRETYYSAATIQANLDGLEMPASALKQTILDVEAELANMVGNSTNEQFRASLAAQSSNLATGAAVPTTDSSGYAFVGAFDGLFDASTGLPLTEQPESVVSRYNTNTGSFFKVNPYYFARVGSKIYHTVSNAVYRGCSWDRTVRATAYDVAGSSPLPQELAVLWICEVLASLPQENWFIQEGAFYRGFAAEKRSQIIDGKIRVMTMPTMPISKSRAE